MKESWNFDKVKTTVKDYFTNYYNELKTDKASLKKFIIVSIVELFLLAFTIVFDLCMKDFLYKFVEIEHGGNYVALEGFMDLTYTENTGAGFGTFKGGFAALSVITSIVIVAMLGFLLIAKRNNMWLRISLVLIAGGGIGNLVDRVNLNYVRDFFEFTFMEFGIFNIADFFVTVGSFMLVFYLIYLIIKEYKDSKKEKESDSVVAEYEAFFAQSKQVESDESDNLTQSVAGNEVVLAENMSNNDTAAEEIASESTEDIK